MERETLPSGGRPAVRVREWEEGAANVHVRPELGGDVDDSWRPWHLDL
jgi:hypothetical protein